MEAHGDAVRWNRACKGARRSAEIVCATMTTTLDIVRERLPDLDTALKRADLNGAHQEFLDARMGSRLSDWLPAARYGEVGLKLREDVDPAKIEFFDSQIKPWNAETVAEQITQDVAFAFEKALDQRGISASLMHSVCMGWARILGFEIDPDDYAQYGLPGIKALALALQLPNPIGDDRGDEEKYEE